MASEKEIEAAKEAILNELHKRGDTDIQAGLAYLDDDDQAAIAKAALEAAERIRWQPINTVPKNGDSVLLGCFGEHSYGFQFIAFWDDGAKNASHRWQTADGVAYHDDLPTNWQRLYTLSPEDK